MEKHIHIIQRQRDYIAAIKPFTDMKAKVYAHAVPTIIIHPDGRMERRYNFTPEQHEALRVGDEEIEALKSRFFGPLSERHHFEFQGVTQ